VQWPETLEHDVKNEREPERSTCHHVPSPNVAECRRMRIMRIAPMANRLFCRIHWPVKAV
jgi:hypothetical protein